MTREPSTALTPGPSATVVAPAPPVPPLPTPFRPSAGAGDGSYNADDPDPFRRTDSRGSQSSWLSENPGWQYEASLSQWSFPASRPPSPHPQPRRRRGSSRGAECARR